jgi:tRNA A37 threonylcarbamoyladenosine dehydratase
VEDFVQPDNWPALLPMPVDVLIDACDQVSAKAALAAWALRQAGPLVCVGAAGGKRQAERVEVDDLADTTHDPLLASLRQRLRKAGAAPRQGRMGVRCVFSREPVRAAGRAATASDGSAGLPRLRLHRHRDGHLRHGGRRRGHRTTLLARGRWWRSLKFPGYNARLCGWVVSSVGRAADF